MSKDNIKALVDRFLTWPLPGTVAADGCATNPNYAFPRSGTNLLNATEAEAMLVYVLGLEDEFSLDLQGKTFAPTPAAQWREKGEADPHGNQYDCERAALTLGTMTDDELANEAFLNYDRRPSIQDLLDGKGFMPIVWMTAVKERIRWLSRALVKAQAAATEPVWCEECGDGITAHDPGICGCCYAVKYRDTAPPPASTNKLTDEQIRRIWLIETGTTEQDSPLAILDFARAVIAATEAK